MNTIQKIRAALESASPSFKLTEGARAVIENLIQSGHITDDSTMSDIRALCDDEEFWDTASYPSEDEWAAVVFLENLPNLIRPVLRDLSNVPQRSSEEISAKILELSAKVPSGATFRYFGREVRKACVRFWEEKTAQYGEWPLPYLCDYPSDFFLAFWADPMTEGEEETALFDAETLERLHETEL